MLRRLLISADGALPMYPAGTRFVLDEATGKAVPMVGEAKYPHAVLKDKVRMIDENCDLQDRYGRFDLVDIVGQETVNGQLHSIIMDLLVKLDQMDKRVRNCRFPALKASVVEFGMATFILIHGDADAR